MPVHILSTALLLGLPAALLPAVRLNLIADRKPSPTITTSVTDTNGSHTALLDTFRAR